VDGVIDLLLRDAVLPRTTAPVDLAIDGGVFVSAEGPEARRPARRSTSAAGWSPRHWSSRTSISTPSSPSGSPGPT
jgi:hypothetical protein